MTQRERMAFSDLFGIALIASWAAGVAVILSIVVWLSLLSGFHVFHFVFGIGAGAISAILFQAALLPALMLVNLVTPRLGTLVATGVQWVLLPLYGAGIGLFLSVTVIYPAIQTSVISGISGIIAGCTSAWLWGYLTKYRLIHPADDEIKGRLLFVPSWMSRRSSRS